MPRLLHQLGLVGLILLVPILPFLAIGKPFEHAVRQWTQHPPTGWQTATAIVVLLATDVFLPVPSSLVSTWGGAQLGIVAGTLATWLGMSLGATLGFAAARRWGRPLALRLANEQDVKRMDQMSVRYGPTLLVLTRAIPVLAEASVLLMGIQRVAWRRFLFPVLLSNLGIAMAYAGFGDIAKSHQWLPVALGVSLALPLLLATFASRKMIEA